jgi:hypothetical protein
MRCETLFESHATTFAHSLTPVPYKVYLKTVKMPISKKDRVSPTFSRFRAIVANFSRLTTKQIQREHKAADKAGTRAPVKANGLPVKAPKPTSIVRTPVA